MAIYSSIVTFFQNGGAFMYPIVLILALGTAIAIERWVFLTMTMAKNKALWNAVTPYLKSGNLQGAMQVTQKSDAAIAQIMTYGLNRVRSARRREDIEQAREGRHVRERGEVVSAFLEPRQDLHQALFHRLLYVLAPARRAHAVEPVRHDLADGRVRLLGNLHGSLEVAGLQVRRDRVPERLVLRHRHGEEHPALDGDRGT